MDLALATSPGRPDRFRFQPRIRKLAAVIMLIGLACALTIPIDAHAAETIGVAKTVVGTPRVKRDADLIAVHRNDQIEFGDSVLTGPAESVVIIFKDDTQLSIGPDSEVTIDSFVFEPRTETLDFKMQVARGAFRFLSGSIAKLKPEAVRIETAAATIGIRGTLLLARIGDDRSIVKTTSGDVVRDASGRPVSTGVGEGGGGPSFFVLRRDPDGNIGEVELRGKSGETVVLDVDRAATKVVGGKLSRRYSASEAEIQEAFPWLIAAIESPTKFTLFFETGTTTLTAESSGLLDEIRSEIETRDARLVSVVGHTDRTGSTADNLQLSISRAEAVREWLLKGGVPSEVLEVTSHGENNPAVDTPDGVAEPRNRRVEVTVR